MTCTKESNTGSFGDCAEIVTFITDIINVAFDI